MKRFITAILVLAMVFTLTAPVFAADADNDGVTIAVGTKVEQNPEIPETRAVSAPTKYAPASWYSVDHKWTAKYYTWSAYIFKCGWFGGSFECWAQAPFTVELYAPDGSFLEAASSNWSSYDGRYEVLFIFGEATDYYVKIINDGSTSILEDAYYCVQTDY